MYKRIFSLLAIIIGFSLIHGFTLAAEPFYKGKTIRIIVGYSAGGGFDAYARIISRHMSQYIPGNPAIIVDNMPGAGSLVAVKYLYHQAKPDGLTIGTFAGEWAMAQILGEPGIDLDFFKFKILGVPVKQTMVIALTKASGITSMEQWMAAKTPVKLGCTGHLDGTCTGPRILKEVLGVPIKLVEGYKGSADIRLAAETGEVNGICLEWESIKTTWSAAVTSGDVFVVLQMAPKTHPELPNIPLATNYAKSEEARLLIKAGFYDPMQIIRLYVLPPDTPAEQVQILRKAFQDTLKDKELLSEANKSRLDINPMTGEETEEIVRGLFELKPTVITKLKEILSPRK